MNKLLQVILLLLGLFLYSIFGYAEYVIEPSVIDQIKVILKNPVKIYDLDLKENDRVFKHIDKQFDKYLDLRIFSCKKKDNEKIIQCSHEVKRNVPIAPPGITVTGIIARKPFKIFYNKEPAARSFFKGLWSPSLKVRSKKVIGELGSRFILHNKLFHETEQDKMLNYIVIAWKSQNIGQNVRDSKKYTLRYRVKYSRQFLGWKVINSKQIVDIHPKSLEILAYKNIDWTPIDNSSGKYKPYVSVSDILDQIHNFFAEDKAEYKIKDVQTVWYQSKRMIFPVIQIKSQRPNKIGEFTPIRQTLLISLIEGLGMDEPDYKIVEPGTPRKDR